MQKRLASVPGRRAVQRGATALAFAIAAHLAGCTSTRPLRLDAWGGGQNCHFAHLSKQEFQTALRRVFDASGPKIYGLRPEEGGALVEQHWTLDVVFASASSLERWRLEYAPAGDGIDVHAEVERAPRAGFASAANTAQPRGDAPSYRLLWSRIQYVLGRRADWPQCKARAKQPRSGLCSGDASAAPPLRLARSK